MVELHDHQKAIVREEIQRKNLLVVAPMGAGKTLATLTALTALIINPQERVRNILIVAPKRVARSVWVQEAAKYDMPLNIRFCDRALDVKLFLCEPTPHHIAVCSVTRIEEIPHGCWDCVVMDESTLFKHHRSKRSKEIRRICNKVPRRIELSGTPVHGGYENLWHQCFLLDGGASLGKTLGSFRERFMRVKYQVNGVVTVFEADPLKIPDLFKALKPLVYVVDYKANLPECLFKNVYVDLPRKVLKQYETLERDFVLTYQTESGMNPYANSRTVIAFSSSALGIKLRQLASGCLYDDEDRTSYTVMHSEKISALKEIRETYDGGILVVYQFKSELNELQTAFPEAGRIETNEDVERWNRGGMGMALVHPASVGHGLNLQFGGHVIVWFSLTYDAELYAQLNKRLHRNGQKETVSIVHLLAKGTIDERVLKVLEKKEDHAINLTKNV
jgi:superfamily II DNA or RNA helicase